jgi:hypothetical protein
MRYVMEEFTPPVMPPPALGLKNDHEQDLALQAVGMVTEQMKGPEQWLEFVAKAPEWTDRTLWPRALGDTALRGGGGVTSKKSQRSPSEYIQPQQPTEQTCCF